MPDLPEGWVAVQDPHLGRKFCRRRKVGTAVSPLGPPVVPFYPCLGEGSPTKISFRKGTLILTSLLEDLQMSVVVKTKGIPYWLGGESTHFRTYFSGDWDVHRGYGILTHSQMSHASKLG